MRTLPVVSEILIVVATTKTLMPDISQAMPDISQAMTRYFTSYDYYNTRQTEF